MNYNTLTPGAKLCKKLVNFATGQLATSGEVPCIGILDATSGNGGDAIVKNISAGILAKGGIPLVKSVQSLGFGAKVCPLTARFSNSFRLTCASTGEALIRANMLDGVVIVGDCEVTCSGLLLGAVRANCPATIMPTGFNPNFSGDVLQIGGKLAKSEMDEVTADNLIADFAPPTGYPGELNTTATFFTLCEVMGFAPIGSARRRQGSPNQLSQAIQTGNQAVTNAKDILTPKRFLTKPALVNATAVCLAIGGTIGAIEFITPLVKACGSKIEHELIPTISARTPLLAQEPNQPCVLDVLATLAREPKLIDTECCIWDGTKISANLGKADDTTLTPVTGGITGAVLCKGNACEKGGFAQPHATTPTNFSGKAWVYKSLDEADKAISQNSIPEGSVIVLHNCLYQNVSCITNTIVGMGMQSKLAVVTDGIAERSPVLTVSNCRPSALDNESFATIQTGDTLDIDLAKGKLGTNVLAKEQKARQKRSSTKKYTHSFGVSE